MTLLSF